MVVSTRMTSRASPSGIPKPLVKTPESNERRYLPRREKVRLLAPRVVTSPTNVSATETCQGELVLMVQSSSRRPSVPVMSSARHSKPSSSSNINTSNSPALQIHSTLRINSTRKRTPRTTGRSTLKLPIAIRPIASRHPVDPHPNKAPSPTVNESYPPPNQKSNDGWYWLTVGPTRY